MASFVYFKVHMWEGFINKWGNMCERVCAIYLCKHLDALCGSGTGRDGHFKPLSFQRMLLNCLPLFPYQALFLLSDCTFHFSFWFFACLVMFLKTHTHKERYSEIHTNSRIYGKVSEGYRFKGEWMTFAQRGRDRVEQKGSIIGDKKERIQKKEKIWISDIQRWRITRKYMIFSYNHFTMAVLQRPPG